MNGKNLLLLLLDILSFNINNFLLLWTPFLRACAKFRIKNFPTKMHVKTNNIHVFKTTLEILTLTQALWAWKQVQKNQQPS
jgi:hypothetical protein